MTGALGFLAAGDMEVLGLLPYASNATLLARLKHADDECLAVYKPRRGERPLWDFPDGTLCLREQAAYELDRALAWELVPPTVLRDGPAGYGAVQLFVEEANEIDPNDLLDTHIDALRRIALFDVIANNTDRKAGHLILDAEGHLWSVDHGICFHAEPKLRTIIWVFEGEPIPAELLAAVDSARADAGLFATLRDLLALDEIDALCARMASVIARGRFPSPGPGGRHVPWPPW